MVTHLNKTRQITPSGAEGTPDEGRMRGNLFPPPPMEDSSGGGQIPSPPTTGGTIAFYELCRDDATLQSRYGNAVATVAPEGYSLLERTPGTHHPNLLSRLNDTEHRCIAVSPSLPLSLSLPICAS